MGRKFTTVVSAAQMRLRHAKEQSCEKVAWFHSLEGQKRKILSPETPSHEKNKQKTTTTTNKRTSINWHVPNGGVGGCGEDVAAVRRVARVTDLLSVSFHCRNDLFSENENETNLQQKNKSKHQ
jgi:hypothetical protein